MTNVSNIDSRSFSSYENYGIFFLLQQLKADMMDVTDFLTEAAVNDQAGFSLMKAVANTLSTVKGIDIDEMAAYIDKLIEALGVEYSDNPSIINAVADIKKQKDLILKRKEELEEARKKLEDAIDELDDAKDSFGTGFLKFFGDTEALDALEDAKDACEDALDGLEASIETLFTEIAGQLNNMDKGGQALAEGVLKDLKNLLSNIKNARLPKID